LDVGDHRMAGVWYLSALYNCNCAISNNARRRQ